MARRKVYLLNSPIVPLPPSQGVEKPAVFIVTKITPKRARQLLDSGEVVSAIGHPATARALSVVLGREVPVERRQIFFEPDDVAIAFVLKARLPEGRVIETVEELQRIGFELYEIYRNK